MKPCILLRHGETAMAGLFCGHSDPPLSDAGREQIELAVSMLGERPKVIYASDLKRARQSAELIASHFDVRSVSAHGTASPGSRSNEAFPRTPKPGWSDTHKA